MPGPAARTGDPTAHGGVITGPGCPTVLIGKMPAARVGTDMQICPMVTPAVVPVPHVGGPITGPGVPTVLIGKMPAATLGDMATCVGPPSAIVMGCPTVLIGTGGGGAAGGGGGAAMAATASAIAAVGAEPGPESTGPHWFDCRFVDSAGNPISEVKYAYTGIDGKTEDGALTLDGRILRGGLPQAGQCSVTLFTVHNAKWSENEAKIGDTLKLTAEVMGYQDGTRARFDIWERDLDGGDRIMNYVDAEVKNKKIEAEWVMAPRQDSDDHLAGDDDPQGYSWPEYYFNIHVEEDRARSGFLKVQDWIEVELKDEQDNLIPNEDYIVYFSNGETRKGKLDGKGYKKIEDVPPRDWRIEFPNLEPGKTKPKA